MNSKKPLCGLFCLLCCSLALVATSVLTGCSQVEPQEEQADFSNAKYVCELATLEVYYHNVARSSHEADWPIFDIGKKRMWFEYSGVVEIGIDASKMEISEPDASNVVTVSLPQAEILDVNLDENSISDPVTETALFTSFTTEEKTQALSTAQQNMYDTAEQDDTLRFQARQRAKELIESYITNIGELTDTKYTVKWVDV